MTRWRPRRIRGDSDQERSYDALHEGVPPWLHVSLWGWTKGFLVDNRGSARKERLEWLERHLRVELGPTAYFRLEDMVASDGELHLDVIDALLEYMEGYGGHNLADHVAALNNFLWQGGSAWQAVNSDGQRYRLERRVLDEVRRAADQTMSSATTAAEHLKSAWVEAYGRDPDPVRAYDASIKAVESACRSVILPDDSRASLSKVIKAIRDKPSKWAVVVHTDAGADADVETVARMMRLLLKGQRARHGEDGTGPQEENTLEEAQAAVHLAVQLVQWFESGAVKAR